VHGCRTRLGLLASAHDKINDDPNNTRDLLDALFPESGGKQAIIVGGQQRLCSVERQQSPLPLPTGKNDDFHPHKDKYLVKWILLTPAIFEQIGSHAGGWLPSWVSHSHGMVQLLDGPGPNAAKRRKVESGKPIDARLVAAMVGKPIPVTGHALPRQDTGEPGGHKPTHLAIPAGSVYYFETTEPEKLAAALNWHGSETNPTSVRNRRSTLFGEKGFGVGICSTWDFHDGKMPR